MINKDAALGFLMIGILMLMAAGVAHAKDSPGLPPPHSEVESAFSAQKHYSPYAGRNFPT